jgi:hypothetical protein
MVANGKPSREWLNREDSPSPTASLESLLLTATVDAHEGQDVLSADVPNAFIQTKMPETVEGEARVMIKISGVLVDLLVQLAYDTYSPYVVYERGRKSGAKCSLPRFYGRVTRMAFYIFTIGKTVQN